VRGCRLQLAQKLSSALIHLAALQLRRLPAGIDPLGFDAGRPHQRCERRFASALSIARRSRSSISSFKCPPARGRGHWPTGKSGKRYRALRPVPACQSSAFLGQLRRTPVGVV
jgi:hypothetical protein